MALLSKDPRMLRKAAAVLLLTVPVFVIEAFTHRDQPLRLAVGLAVPLVIAGCSAWLLQRARRLPSVDGPVGDPTPVAGIAATGWVMLCAALVIERHVVGAVVAAVIGALAGAAYVSGRKRRTTA